MFIENLFTRQYTVVLSPGHGDVVFLTQLTLKKFLWHSCQKNHD